MMPPVSERENDGALRAEVGSVARLAGPIALTQLCLMGLGTVDLLMVARLDKAETAALLLGNVWKMATQLVAMGFVFGMDPFISQAHGAGDARGAGLALQRGVVLGLAAALALGVVWLLAEPGLVLLGQDPEAAHAAGRYVAVQVPSLPFFMGFVALRQYLTGRRIVRPTLWVVVVANVLNVGLNWVLVFGHLGFPRLGALGSGIATSVVQVSFLVLLFGWARTGRLFEGAWVPWSRAALDLEKLFAMLRVGVPTALQLAFEVWAFQIVVLWAGWLGEVELVAHGISFNLIALAFMVPLGTSMAAATRVGNLLGESRPGDAQRAAWVSLCLAGGFMLLSAAALVLFREALPGFYTDDASVLALCASILPIAAAFQLFDGLQVVGGGVLRGMGRTRPSAVFHLLGFYLLGLPLAYWLAFERGIGLAGLWWGLALALCVISIAFLAWIARRGPATCTSVTQGEGLDPLQGVD